MPRKRNLQARAGRGWIKCLAPIALAAFIALPLAGQGAPDEAKLKAYGRHLSQECTVCHRIDGIDNGIPSIIGWQANVFIDTVKFYQAGKRTNPVMVSVAGSLNDEQLTALAKYFASLPKPAPKASADKKAKK